MLIIFFLHDLKAHQSKRLAKPFELVGCIQMKR